MFNPDCPITSKEESYNTFLHLEMKRYSEEYVFALSKIIHMNGVDDFAKLLLNSAAKSFLEDNNFDELFAKLYITPLHTLAWLGNFKVFCDRYEKIE